jgi:hypothetical protein
MLEPDQAEVGAHVRAAETVMAALTLALPCTGMAAGAGGPVSAHFGVSGAYSHEMFLEHTWLWKGSHVLVYGFCDRGTQPAYDRLAMLAGTSLAFYRKRGDGTEDQLSVQFERGPTTVQYGPSIGTPLPCVMWRVNGELSCGEHVLRAAVPAGTVDLLHDDGVYHFIVVPPTRLEHERAIWTWRVRLHVEMGEFVQAEDVAFEMADGFGVENMPFLALSHAYHATGHISRAKSFLVQAVLADPSISALSSHYYGMLAAALGEAATVEEGSLQLYPAARAVMECPGRVHVPDEFLKPILGGPERRRLRRWMWFGAGAAIIVAADALVVWFILRRRRRMASQ